MENNMINTEWRYFGVFINEESKKLILSKFSEQIPEGWKIYCDHMTMAFNKHEEEQQALFNLCHSFIGKEYYLNVIGTGKSDKAFALRISSPLPTLNSVAHITIAVSPDGKPVESNYIKDWVRVDPFEIKGTLEVR